MKAAFPFSADAANAPPLKRRPAANATGPNA
jgi:hypothetical protein